MRTYEGYTFDFEPIAAELFRVTKQGGVVVWVAGDATVNGSETGASFRQALEFMGLGFRLHDTMIYRKNSYPYPPSNRYYNVFEFMFVLSKGKPGVVNLLRCQSRGRENSGSIAATTFRGRDGQMQSISGNCGHAERIRDNVWSFSTGYMRATTDKFAYEHPAIFPEALARDHILTWSNPGGVVLDPMCGSGTTLKMAKQLGRQYLGFDIAEEYVDLARRRLAETQPPLFTI